MFRGEDNSSLISSDVALKLTLFFFRGILGDEFLSVDESDSKLRETFFFVEEELLALGEEVLL